MQPESTEDLRRQLEAAIGKVRHQIAVQSTADHYIGSGAITEAALGALRSELARLEAALAGLA